MPIGEITGELLGSALRLIGHFFIEVILEILVKGLGYLIYRPFSKTVDPEGVLVAFVGLVAWIAIGLLIYLSVDYLSVQMEIDSCLDAGGRYNYVTNGCEQ